MANILTMDVGGTHIRALVEGDDGRHEHRFSTHLTPLLRAIDALLTQHKTINRIAIAYAGQIHNGVIVSAPNIAVDEPHIQEAVEKRYKIPLHIDNDLKCALLAQAAYHRNPHIGVMMVGTGLGGALMDANHVVRGVENIAFELGHIPYLTSPLVCGCGRSNCVELYASGSGLAKWQSYEKRDDAIDLAAWREANDPRYVRFEEALLHAAGTLVTLGNPKLLVVGGGIIDANGFLVDVLHDKLKNYALHPARKNLQIVRDRLEDAPLKGAKLLMGGVADV